MIRPEGNRVTKYDQLDAGAPRQDVSTQANTDKGKNGMSVIDASSTAQSLTFEMEQLLYLEADLLDARRYDEWLDLLADDFEYVVPLRRNVEFSELDERENSRPGTDVCWFDESKATVVQRVKQLMTGVHWAEEPASRTSHHVSNVRVHRYDDDAVHVGSRLLIYRNRMAAETNILSARRSDAIRRGPAGWQLTRREVLLDQNVLELKNITFFL